MSKIALTVILFILAVLNGFGLIGYLGWRNSATRTIHNTTALHRITLHAPNAVSASWNTLGGVVRIGDCVTFLEAETHSKMTVCGAIVVEKLGDEAD